MVDSRRRSQVVNNARDYNRKDIDRGAQVDEPGFESDFDRDKKGFYRHKVSVNGTFCSFSGLENIATNLNKQGKDNSEICYFIFEIVSDYFAD